MLQLSFTNFPELVTGRLHLRQFSAEDADALLQLRSGSQSMQYMDRDPMQTQEEAEELIDRIKVSFQNADGISWVICFKGNNEMIGYAGIWRIDKANFRGEVGYMLNPAFWNKGIMTEALNAVVDFGFNKMALHSLEANINPDNSASIKIVEKLGFEREAYFKENYYYRGRFLDSAIYSLLNKSQQK